jgi:hypothetical protein
VALAMANVVVVAFLIVCVSIILVWVPVYDGRSANHRVQLQVRRGPGTGGGGGAGMGGRRHDGRSATTTCCCR